MSKIKVLFLASNPIDGAPLKLDEEIRAITQKLRASEYRDSINLISAWAVRPDDLLQYFNEHKPQIVHLSGHGSKSGEIVLVGDNGEPRFVNPVALKSMFRVMQSNIKVVLLNACYSHIQAQAIRETIDCTIGINSSITDKAATIFSASFYRALGFGRSVLDAFEQGKIALLLEGISEDEIPELLPKDGIDLSKLFLLNDENTDEQSLLFQQGLIALKSKVYSQAFTYLEKILSVNIHSADLYYYLALSTLEGKRPRLLSLVCVKKAENYLKLALQIDSNCSHAVVLWALIKYDFYVLNKMYETPPTFEQLENSITGVNSERAAEIIFHITAPENKIWKLLQ